MRATGNIKNDYQIKDRKDELIDLTPFFDYNSNTKAEDFLCDDCKLPLKQIKDEIKIKIFPHAAQSRLFQCVKCDRIYSESTDKLLRAKQNMKPASITEKDEAPFLEMIDDHPESQIRDPYEEINSRFEPNADDQIKYSGGEIISSEITLTDSSGNNRTLVKRKEIT